MDPNLDGPETLDAEKETFGGAMARAFFWSIVFGELILIYGARR